MLLENVKTNFYTSTRKPGFMYAYDGSTLRIGKQATKNWIGSVLSDLKVPWSDHNLSKDSIRVLLKKCFYIPSDEM